MGLDLEEIVRTFRVPKCLVRGPGQCQTATEAPLLQMMAEDAFAAFRPRMSMPHPLAPMWHSELDAVIRRSQEIADG